MCSDREREKIINFAQRHLRQRVLVDVAHRGWDASPGDRDWQPVNPAFLYVLDLSSDTAVMGAINWDDLSRIEHATSEFTTTEIRGAIPHLLQIPASDPSFRPPTAPRDVVLMTMVARYLRETETFASLAPGTPGCHLVVLVHRADRRQTSDAFLRPFCLVSRPGPVAPLPHRDLMQLVEPVILQDREKHPEWFGMGQIKAFRGGKR